MHFRQGVLDRLTDQRRSPVRVEVREADGTVFTDIITPSRRRAVPEPPGRPAAPAPLPVLYGDGFVPGEDIAVAVIVAPGLRCALEAMMPRFCSTYLRMVRPTPGCCS